VAALAISVSVLSGCSGSADPQAAVPTRTSTAVTTSPAPTPELLDQCTHQLEYWAEQILADFDDPGWDYQEMGLSSAKYTELRAVLAEARAMLATGPLPSGWMHDHLEGACGRVLALPPPISGAVGWP
jgi:hypothetical protein